MADNIENAEDGSMFVGGVRISKEDVDRIRKEAELKAKKTLEREATDKLTRQMTAEAEADMRRKAGVNKKNEVLVDVLIDLPEFADRITLDGKEFFHGSIVKVTEGVARTLNEQMQVSWRHQNQVDGVKHNPYQRHKNQNIGKGGIQPMTV